MRLWAFILAKSRGLFTSYRMIGPGQSILEQLRPLTWLVNFVADHFSVCLFFWDGCCVYAQAKSLLIGNRSLYQAMPSLSQLLS